MRSNRLCHYLYIRSIKQLLGVLQVEWNESQASSPPPQALANVQARNSSTTPPPVPPLPANMSAKARGKLPAHIAANLSNPGATGSHTSYPNVSISSPAPTHGRPASQPGRTVRFSTSPLTDSHRRIRMRLLPLLAIEEELTKKLFPELSTNSITSPTGEGWPPGIKEVCVRAGSGWKGVLGNFVGVNAGETNGMANGNGKDKGRPVTNEAKKDDPTTVLAACREDIVSLWEDQTVRAVLKKRGVRLQDMPGL